MKINAKRIQLAFRSPRHFVWAVRHVVRNSALGRLDRWSPSGTSFRPNLITVNITGRCNLRCEMCMQPRGKIGRDDDTATLAAGGRELTLEEWGAVVDQAAPARPAFYFTGGEPLLYRGIADVLDRVKSRGMIAALVTNGTALSHYAERLVEIGIDNVTVSIDGPEAVHDRIRGVAGAFRKAVEGILALREARGRAGVPYPAVKVNCVITPESLDTLEETYRIVSELGVEEINFQHPIFDTAENVALHNKVFREALKSGMGVSPMKEHGQDARATTRAAQEAKSEGEFYAARIREDEFERLESALRRILASRSPATRVLFFPDVKPGDWRGYYLDLRHPFPEKCHAPWTTMRFLADGTFEPCLRYPVGNALETPLWELWNHERMRRFRLLIRRGLFPACVRCCYRCY